MNLDETESSSVAAPARGGRRAWRLAVWLALVAGGLAWFWTYEPYQDYKNTGVAVAVVLALFGTSVWAIRSPHGTRTQRWVRALLAWAPLAVISPLGPVKLDHNGNVGIKGWRWRWAPQHDELLDAARSSGRAISWRETSHDYPAFLGGHHWAEIEGVELDPHWEKRPPKELWRQPIGAGWSSFAVVGDYAVTQEQRGPAELVVCYEARTGAIAWSHEDEVRWDPGGSGALGKVGPRATPTIANGRVYTQGATGILNCLDATTGRVVWSHDLPAEEHAEIVMWGKACSPLIVDGWVVVSVGGTHGNSLIAYDRETGEKAWSAGSRRSSYATPVLAELQGQRQIIVVNEDFVTAHDAANGHVLWEYPWPGNSDSNASASQPVPIVDDRLLLTKGYSVQAEVIQVGRSQDGAWSVQRVWQKLVMRTKMSNVVVRDGYAYGIDDIDLECIDLTTGQRQWRARRRPEVGNGQVMLVGDVVLVLSEEGELILVEATPEKYVELAAMPALSGVTWNNPALAGNLLLVRNAEEAAAFELPLANGEKLARRH